MSNRRKLRPRITPRPRPVPQLRRMTVRHPETGADISERFGVPAELRPPLVDLRAAVPPGALTHNTGDDPYTVVRKMTFTEDDGPPVRLV